MDAIHTSHFRKSSPRARVLEQKELRQIVVLAVPGGIPIVVGGKTIGDVGVSGGNDLQIAKAAVKGLP